MQKETPAKAQKVKLALRAAFPMTIPVMVGYLFLGAAFGILLESKGYGFGWAALMSVATVRCGALASACLSMRARCNLWRSICWRRERAFCRWR